MYLAYVPWFECVANDPENWKWNGCSGQKEINSGHILLAQWRLIFGYIKIGGLGNGRSNGPEDRRKRGLPTDYRPGYKL
jgi:hypothetical protein